MAETTTQELLDAGELIGAARRESAFAERAGYTTTATLLARLADAVEGGVSAEDFNLACDQKRSWRDRARAAEDVLREITNMWPASTATTIAQAYIESVGAEDAARVEVQG